MTIKDQVWVPRVCKIYTGFLYIFLSFYFDTKFMPRTVVIEFSLVEESRKRADIEIIDDIKDAFSNEEICVPWCSGITKIALN